MDNVADVTKPQDLDVFLAKHGWAEAHVSLLAADASFRRYFRATDGERQAVIMDAPPPHEDPRPFVNVAEYLSANGFRAPAIIGTDLARGLVILEDFGDIRMREYLDENPSEESAIYRQAIEVLAKLARSPAADVPPYDMAAYMREVQLFTEWYVPAMGLSVKLEEFDFKWQLALSPIVDTKHRNTTVLRDYHAENIMLLTDGTQGIIDFQDALLGHPAYDLVSLLQDARRDVSAELEAEMLEHYASVSNFDADFDAHYALLGAQRNTKIIGIFTRLWKRDGKARYLSFLSRMWTYLERDLAHPELAELKAWFDVNIPAEVRRKMPHAAPSL